MFILLISNIFKWIYNISLSLCVGKAGMRNQLLDIYTLIIQATHAMEI